MKALLTTLMVASVLVQGARLAYADPPTVTQLSDLDPVYIGLGASEGSSPSHVRFVDMEDSVTIVALDGESDFTLNVFESHPGTVTNCWTYFDGSVYTGTSPTLSAEDYRTTYGCVIIKFSDNSFDYAGFEVWPAWDSSQSSHVASLTNSPPSTPVTLPSGLPSEVQSVFGDVSEIDPVGPEQVTEFPTCLSEEHNEVWELWCRNAPATVPNCSQVGQKCAGVP